MRILLLTPLIGVPKTEPPLGLCYIQACLDKAGYTDSNIVDIYDSYEEIKKIIEDYDPDIVGISCFTTYRNSSFKLAKLAKEIKPDIKVVLGGPHATFMWEQIMKNFPSVDFIVIGEGEITMVELVKVLDKGLSLKKVKGIVFRNNGKIIKTEPRPLIKNLDELPFPSYRNMNLEKYAIPTPPTLTTKEVKANLITSRGCPFGCTFCSTTQFWGRFWRPRSAKNVVDELEWLNKEYGVKFFSFSDDVFSVNQQRVIDICKEIIKRNLKIKWFTETRVDCVSKEMLEWMKKAGCYMLEFGVESGSPRIIKNINKMITLEQIRNAFKWAREVGLETEILLMIGNPEESWETINETKKLLDEAKPDIIIVSLTHIFPATQLYELAKQKGLINDDYWLTDKTIPEYTADNSLKKLVKMRLDLVRYFYRNKGRLSFTKYVIGQIKKNPKVLLDHVKAFLGR